MMNGLDVCACHVLVGMCVCVGGGGGGGSRDELRSVSPRVQIIFYAQLCDNSLIIWGINRLLRLLSKQIIFNANLYIYPPVPMLCFLNST